MRPVVELAWFKRPHIGKGRVEQFKAAVAAEHGDALLQGIKRFALHADRGIILRNEMVAFSDIVEKVSDAALGIGANDGPQRPPVRQNQTCSSVSSD